MLPKISKHLNDAPAKEFSSIFRDLFFSSESSLQKHSAPKKGPISAKVWPDGIEVAFQSSTLTFFGGLLGSSFSRNMGRLFCWSRKLNNESSLYRILY